MPTVLRLARVVSVAVALAALPARAAPSARLAATPSAGAAPLVVAFDSAGSTAGTIAEHLLLTGNGDAISLASAAQTTTYNYTLPGFYLAQSWLRDESGVAVSLPVAISVSRDGDGRAPATAVVTAAPTTDPSSFAFEAAVTAQPDDPIAAARWDFGDGQWSGDAEPLHHYAAAGVYQAALVATTRAGLPLFGRVMVVAGGGAAPALVVTVSPEDAALLTPVTVTAYLEGVPPDAKLTGVAVQWPDLVDASPTVTATASGITITSAHALAAAGYYDVVVQAAVDGQPAPLLAAVQVRVGNIDDSAPSPVVLRPPAAAAAAGRPYAPNLGGPTAGALLVAGDGPFAFGPATPSPTNFGVDAEGNVSWTPTRTQVGPERLAVRIVDAQGKETVESWVVDVSAGGGGCAVVTTGGAPWATLPLALLWALVVLARAMRRGRATA